MSFEEACWLLPPRVVVLVSTIDGKGKENLAPHSEFVKLYTDQFLLCIEKSHDTYKNIKETGEFVVAFPTIEIARETAITGKPFPKGVSEFEKAGLTPIKAKKVKASLVKECMANFECSLSKELGTIGTEAILVGDILETHYDKERVLSEAKTRLSSKLLLNVEKGRIYTTIGGKPVDTKVDYKKYEAMAMNIFIIHGTFGSPSENWFPWLEEELEKEGHEVFVPRFPTPEGQNLENWLKVFEEYEQRLDSDSVLVGHSLGPAFILNVLERIKKPVKAALFVAGFTGSLGNPKYDGLNNTFAAKEFNWEKIKKNCGSFFVFHSDNDPYVPLEKAKKLAQKLGIEPIVVKDAGHFNESADYTEFPLLLEKIKGILAK